MPVIKVDNKQFSLRPGQNRLGVGDEADVRVDADSNLGVQAIVELEAAGGRSGQAVIRRAANDAAVRVNGIPLVDPTPLMHGDKVEIAGKELLFAEDNKSGATAFVTAKDVAAMLAAKRAGPARATAATGGRLVSLVDGKEYAIPAEGIVIGRDASADVVVAQNDVSRKHAEVVPVSGGYELRDHSANGVFVNGSRLEEPQVLYRADVIRVGSEEFRFYADPLATPPVGGVAVATPPVSMPVASVPAPAPIPVAPQAPATKKVALASLEVLNAGPSQGQLFQIYSQLTHVGRGPHNDIVLTDESVSESHAKLQRRHDGWYVIDVDSTNGTYVGGQRLTSERRLDGLPDVRFGGVKFLFRAHDVPAPSLSDTVAVASTARSPSVHTAATAPRSAPALADAKASAPGRKSSSIWLWAVVVLAIGAAAAFFLLKPS